MANPPPLQVQGVSTEEENGFRLQLLIQKTTEVLRNKFHQHFSNNPSTLYQELSAHRQRLTSLLSRRIIYQDQYSLLFPANGLTDSGSFDICLLTCLLRSLCGLPAPATGWCAVPLPTDQTESAHLVRIRIGRNKVQHGALKWHLTDFTEVWDEISDSIIGLGCTTSELNDLKIRPLDSSTLQNLKECRADLKAALEKVAHLEDCLNGLSYEMFPPIPSFIGRENDIQKIHENLINMDDGKIALVISGFGGVGKSELVRRYCQEFGVKFYKNNTIWINAKSTSSITSVFNNVAELIKLDVKDANGQFSDIKVVITKVFRFFAGTNVLFVFDNVVDEADVSAYLSLYVQPGVQKPYVIITSQNVEWGQRYITQNIKVFTPVIAEAFVNRTLENNNSLNSENNEKLCELVEYLPLALQQTVAYIQKTGITVENYLKEFKSHKQLLLSEGHNDTMYSKTVMTTWNMAIGKIKETKNPLALTLLTIMGYLDGKNINKMLFLDLCDNDLIALNKSINILEQYSIINVSESNDYTKETITIHSLVQFVVLINEQVCNNEPQKLVLSFLRTILQKSKNVSKENFAFENLWVDHVIFMIVSHENKDIIHIFIEYVNILYEVLKRKGKLHQLQASIQTLEIFLSKTGNSNEYDNFNISVYLAMSLQHQGKLNKAMEIYYDAEKKGLTLFGPNHESVITTQNNIASCLLVQGKLNEALEIFYDVEKKYLTLIGPNHESLLTTQNNIASCLRLQGKLNEALEIYYDAENKRLRFFGPNHESVLKSQNNIALCLQGQGKLNRALEIYYDVEKKGLTLFGPNHESVLITQNNIASCLRVQGKLNGALEIYYDVEKKGLTLFGPNSESVLAAQSNIAICLLVQGKLNEALEIFYDVEKKYLTLIGPNHESLLTTQNNIATCLRLQGKLNEALEIYYDVEKKRLTLFGPNHPSVINTRACIVYCTVFVALMRFIN